MNEDAFNMSMRKFLKQVGVTSQQQLGKAVENLPEGTTSINAKMVLSVEGSDLNHVVEGTIELGE